MKRCPECRKDYLDDSLLYCLDDGTPLVQGSVTDEPATALLSVGAFSDDGQTRLLPAERTEKFTSSLSRVFSSKRFPWVGAGILLVGLIATLPFAVQYLRQPRIADPTKAAFQLQPPRGSSGIGQIAISPDGRNIAVVANSEGKPRLWLRTIDSLEGRPVPGTDGAAGFPFWSPDGRSIGFQAAGKLKRIDLADGTVRDMAVLSSDIRGFDGTWNRDGTMLYQMGGSGILRIAAAGGAAQPLPGYEPRQDGIDRWPRFLPDGKHFLFLSTSTDESKSELYIGSTDDPERKLLFASDSNAFYAPRPGQKIGHLLFARGGALLAHGFDPDTHQLSGEPFRVAENIRVNFNSRAFFSVSDNGTLVYDPNTEEEESRQLSWYDRAGKAIGTAGQPGPVLRVELSPDERFLAVTKRAAGTANDLIINDTVRGAGSRLGEVSGDTPEAIWSPDGKYVVWNDGGAGKYRLVKKLASGAGELEVLVESPIRLYPSDWSPDGKFILYTAVDILKKRDLWVLPLEGDRKPYLYFQSPLEDRYAVFSPDGKYVAYTSEESGRDEIYVQTFPASAGKWPISTNGGLSVRWPRKGQELFYIQIDGKVMSVDVKPGAAFEAGVPKPLFDVVLARSPRGDDYAISNDGQRFIFISRGIDGEAQPLVVILNWSAGAGR